VRVGVVTPTLNAERFLRETLESIRSQQSHRIEIDHVLVDAGSIDRTTEIASGFPTRVLMALDGRGMYDQIDRGMREVKGDIVGYINGDDEIAPGALNAVADALDDHPDAGWVCGRMEYIDESGGVLGRMQPVRVSLRSFAGIGWSCIPQQTVWARRSFFDRVGPFDTTLRNCADYDWYARALRLQHPVILRQTLGRYRLHGAQLSLNQEAMERESRMVKERNGGMGFGSFLLGKVLSLRLNARNPRWLIAKKTGRIKFTA